MHYNTYKSWELRKPSLKMNCLDVWTSFPNYYSTNYTETSKENLNNDAGDSSCWPAPFQSGSVIGPLCFTLSISVPGVPSQSHHRFSRGRTLRYNNRDRPEQISYCEVLFATCKLLCLQSFALTSTSSSGLPLMYAILAGFLKMVLSNGWFWIKLHLCIKIFFRFLTPEWYVVTNGNICPWVFFFCFKADCLPAKETSNSILSLH